MELSILLGQITGVYMLIIGISFLARQKMWSEVVNDFVRNRALMSMVGLGELLLGLVIVILHNEWAHGYQAIITIIGWLMVIEGGSYLLLPKDFFKKNIKKLNNSNLYISMGIVCIVIGGYLIYATFGL